MLLAFALAIIVSIIRGYNPKYILKTWTMYPFIALAFIHVFFQITVFCNDYRFVNYAMLLKRSELISLVIPLIFFSFYREGFIGTVGIVIGTLMNKFVMAHNGGKMPVYPTLSYITGYVDEYSFIKGGGIHMLGNSDCSYKILSDWIDTGISIFSIGDLFILIFTFLILYNTIKVMNDKYNPIKEA